MRERAASKQQTLPAAPQPSVAEQAFSRLGHAYEYLTKAGWRQVGINEKMQEMWQDPKAGGKAERRKACELPGRNEEPPIPVYQLYLPPVAWDYPTDLAVQLQRERDRGGETLESLVEAKRRELADLEAQLKKNKAEVEATKKAG